MTNQNKAVATATQSQPPYNPFGKLENQHINAGTVAIEESRAIAEAQGKLIVAKKFPRNPAAAFEKVMLSCKRRGLAEKAVYAYPRGGQTVSGPSIRLAEELARAWGNIDFGIRELSQKEGLSEMEAYCWDLETNTMSSIKFTVKHERHTRAGVTRLTDPRDIYEITANQAGRRLRARIIAVLPPDLVDLALEECAKTIAGNNSVPIQDRVRKMLSAFSAYGVTKAHIENYLQMKLENVLPEHIVTLTGIHNALRDNTSRPSDFFNMGQEAKAETENVNLQIGTKLNEKQIATSEAVTAVNQAPQANSVQQTTNTTDDEELI